MNSEETYRGIVHGSMIELQTSPGMPDGVEVDVIIRQTKLTREQRLEKLKSLFGSCKDDANDLDQFILWNDEQRKRNRAEQSP